MPIQFHSVNERTVAGIGYSPPFYTRHPPSYPGSLGNSTMSTPSRMRSRSTLINPPATINRYLNGAQNFNSVGAAFISMSSAPPNPSHHHHHYHHHHHQHPQYSAPIPTTAQHHHSSNSSPDGDSSMSRIHSVQSQRPRYQDNYMHGEQLRRPSNESVCKKKTLYLICTLQ